MLIDVHSNKNGNYRDTCGFTEQTRLKEEADAQGLVWSYGKVKEVEFNFGNVVFWVHIHTAKSLSIC